MVNHLLGYKDIDRLTTFGIENIDRKQVVFSKWETGKTVAGAWKTRTDCRNHNIQCVLTKHCCAWIRDIPNMCFSFFCTDSFLAISQCLFNPRSLEGNNSPSPACTVDKKWVASIVIGHQLFSTNIVYTLTFFDWKCVCPMLERLLVTGRKCVALILKTIHLPSFKWKLQKYSICTKCQSSNWTNIVDLKVLWSEHYYLNL